MIETYKIFKGIYESDLDLVDLSLNLFLSNSPNHSQTIPQTFPWAIPQGTP